MSKFGSDIRKELKKIHDEAATKVRKLLKSKKALLIYMNPAEKDATSLA